MRLKELREERNLTQMEVAKAIETSQSNIGRWEKGLNEPAASYLIKLANLFNVSTDYLLGISNDFDATPATEEKNAFFETEDIFSQRLRALRESDKLSQIAFAEKIGFSQAAISSWENNTREPGIEALLRIARFFNVSVDYLVGYKQELPSAPALSRDEKELLSIYQKLPYDSKQRLIARAEVMLEDETKSRERTHA